MTEAKSQPTTPFFQSFVPSSSMPHHPFHFAERWSPLPTDRTIAESLCVCSGWTPPSRTAPFTSSERWLCPPSQGRESRTRHLCRLALLYMESSGKCWSSPGTNVLELGGNDAILNVARLTSVGYNFLYTRGIYPSISRIRQFSELCKPLPHRYPTILRDLYVMFTLTWGKKTRLRVRFSVQSPHRIRQVL